MSSIQPLYLWKESYVTHNWAFKKLIISEMKSSLDRFSSELPTVEERIRELEDKSVEIIYTDAQGKIDKRKMNKAIISYGTVSCSLTFV